MRYLVILVVLLAGCVVSPEQRQARVDAAIAEMGRACSKIGHQAGSAEHKECVTRLLAAETGKPEQRGAVVAPQQPQRMQTYCYQSGSGVVCY